MNVPKMFEPLRPAADVTSLVSYVPVPGYGVLPVNAFVIASEQPVLVDTGLAALETDFMRTLEETIDPAELRWIWITHADPDHLGNLRTVLARAPQARVVTTYIGMAKMGLHGLALDRVQLLNPGQQLDVGGRMLTAVAPPTYDAPETVGLYDRGSGSYFSADSFGALLESPAEHAHAISEEALREGSIAWARVDSPWLGVADRGAFRRRLRAIGDLGAQRILGSHLPPAADMTDRLLGYLDAALDAPCFEGPDQAAFDRMMAA